MSDDWIDEIAEEGKRDQERLKIKREAELSEREIVRTKQADFKSEVTHLIIESATRFYERVSHFRYATEPVGNHGFLLTVTNRANGRYEIKFRLDEMVLEWTYQLNGYSGSGKLKVVVEGGKLAVEGFPDMGDDLARRMLSEFFRDYMQASA